MLERAEEKTRAFPFSLGFFFAHIFFLAAVSTFPRPTICPSVSEDARRTGTPFPFLFLFPRLFVRSQVLSFLLSHSAFGNVKKDGGLFQIVRMYNLMKFLLEEDNVTG